MFDRVVVILTVTFVRRVGLYWICVAQDMSKSQAVDMAMNLLVWGIS